MVFINTDVWLDLPKFQLKRSFCVHLCATLDKTFFGNLVKFGCDSIACNRKACLKRVGYYALASLSKYVSIFAFMTQSISILIINGFDCWSEGLIDMLFWSLEMPSNTIWMSKIKIFALPREKHQRTIASEKATLL